MANIIPIKTYSLDGSRKNPRKHLDKVERRKIHGNTVVTFSAYVETKTNKLNDFIAVMNEHIANGDLLSHRVTSKSKRTRMFGATPTAMRNGIDRIEDCHLKVLEHDQEVGEIISRGRVSDVRRLIPNLDLSGILIDQLNCRIRSGEPFEVRGGDAKFVGISGLDTVPIAKPHFRKLELDDGGRLASKSVGLVKPKEGAGVFNPLTLKRFFNVPGGTGKGGRIGVVALGGGYDNQNTIDFVINDLKLQGKKIKVVPISVDGAIIKLDGNADIETQMDVEGSGGSAYDAVVYIVFAPNTDTGFTHAIKKLIDLKCTSITISWGSAEINWTAQAIAAMHAQFQRAQLAGISVYAAAGDNLAPDSVDDGSLHVDYPSSDTCVMSAIGIFISQDGKIVYIWNNPDGPNGPSGSGGGVSDVNAQQAWEKFGRQVASLNDGVVRHWVGGLAINGDPACGINVWYNRKPEQVAGTSLGGPLLAGYTECTNEVLGHSLGFWLPLVAKNPKLCVPVTQGNNAAPGGKGYDAVDLTVGMPDFTAILEAVRAAA